MEILLLGLDGLEPSLIKKWEDDLPTLSDLIENGSFGQLRSSDPPLSSPAWQWMFTGKQGGKHSIFGFTRQKSDSYERVPVNLDDVQAETLWEILDAEGISCGVVNVPETYPPTELEHGFMISGWPIPNRVNPGTPESVIDDLEADIGESYKVNPTPMGPELKDFSSREIYEALCEAIDHHERAFISLAQRHDPSVFFCVFTATDIAGHYLAWDKKNLHDLYVRQDQAVASLLDVVSDDVDVVALSDHGHGAKGTLNFHVNEWLNDEGYLHLKARNEGMSLTRNFLRSVGVTRRNALRVKNAIGLGNPREYLPQLVFDLAKRTVPPEDKRNEGVDSAAIDWSQTSAFAASEQNMIFLNTESARSEGTVSSEEALDVRDEIASKLAALDHPDRDEPLVTDIKKNDEIFSGQFADQAPGIVFICDEMRCKVHPGLNDGEVFSDNRLGEHRPWGLLLTSGPSFAATDTVEKRSILDVFPLVLALTGVKIPENIDGEIPQDRLEEPIEPSFRESYDDHSGLSDYSGEESEEVKKQLRGLGYLE